MLGMSGYFYCGVSIALGTQDAGGWPIVSSQGIRYGM